MVNNTTVELVAQVFVKHALLLAEPYRQAIRRHHEAGCITDEELAAIEAEVNDRFDIVAPPLAVELMRTAAKREEP